MSGKGGQVCLFSILLSLTGLAISMGLLVWKLRDNVMPLMAFSLVLGLMVTSVNDISPFRKGDAQKPLANVATIDISHAERFSLDPSSPNNGDGLALSLMRNGYLPLLMREFSATQIKTSSVLALIAPAMPFKGSEIRAIRDFVAKGGLLILASGWEEQEGSDALMSEFGMEVINIPLGRVNGGQDAQEVSLWNVWPLNNLNNKKWTDTEVLVRAWDYPVIISRNHERGAVLAVGDSSFFLNKNFEGVYNFHEGNILFLKRYIETFNRRKAQHE